MLCPYLGQHIGSMCVIFQYVNNESQLFKWNFNVVNCVGTCGCLQVIVSNNLSYLCCCVYCCSYPIEKCQQIYFSPITKERQVIGCKINNVEYINNSFPLANMMRHRFRLEIYIYTYIYIPAQLLATQYNYICS